MIGGVPVIAVHGFMYDPKDAGGSNDPAVFFEDLSGIVGRPVDGFAWYSAPFGFRVSRPFHSVFQTARAWLGSWGKGKLHPYRLAWDLAVKAGEDLAAKVNALEGQVDIVAHSLGARVTLTALLHIPAGKVRRVIFFNGAELCSNVIDFGLGGAAVLNIAFRRDKVLKLLGANFSGDKDGPCIGCVGLRLRLPGWLDVFLDDTDLRKAARSRRGWTLRGDAPDDMLDHGESYRFAGNSDLVRAWLAGDDLSDITT